MAEHVLPPTPTTRTPVGRRTLALGTALVGAAAAIGITAGTAAPQLDAVLLALGPRLRAALANVDTVERDGLPAGASLEDHPEVEEWLDATCAELIAACEAIVGAPEARTAEGRALKAAAAMQQLREGFCYGQWSSKGEELAWSVLSELAGDSYTPPYLPLHLKAGNEPARRMGRA